MAWIDASITKENVEIAAVFRKYCSNETAHYSLMHKMRIDFDGFQNAVNEILEKENNNIKIINNEIYSEEIGFGEKLIWNNKIVFEVQAFRIYPTPRVWDGNQWYILANCRRV